MHYEMKKKHEKPSTPLPERMSSCVHANINANGRMKTYHYVGSMRHVRCGPLPSPPQRCRR